MKKYFYYLLLPLLVFTLTSCVTRDDEVKYIDYDTIGTVYDIQNVDFNYSNTDGYTISRTFTKDLQGGDVLLVYRRSGSTNNGSPIWQQIPRTLYLDQGELDYDFDFSKHDVLISAGGNYDLSTTLNYINNQTFRVVVVPASTTGTTKIDYSNYEAVANFLNIKNAKIQKL